MLKNYLKIGWRNLVKDKTFTLLNVVGLSVAFGVAILLSMAAFFDLSYDKFHENVDSIYQVYTTEQTAKGQEVSTSQPAPFAEALRAEVPGIENISRYLQDEAIITYKDKEINMDAVWVDEDFFEMFTFPTLEGTTNNPLQEQSSIVITKNTSNKLFGEKDAIGETVDILINGKEEPFTVSAVVENNLPQSTLEFELAVRFEKHRAYATNRTSWNSKYHSVYVQLHDGVTPLQFDKGTRSLINLNYQEEIENAKRDGAQVNADGLYFQVQLLPLADVHFTGFRKGYAEVTRSKAYLILGIAFLILFIACVNFINMSIAKSAQRLREIGMRKTLGAQKKQLFLQFWSESLFVFLASVGIGVLLSKLLLDDFKTIFRTDVSLEMVSSPSVILMSLAFVLLVTLIVGGYPALLLSRLGTVQSLKGKLQTTGKNKVRDVLMVVQFGIAILLISGTLVLWANWILCGTKTSGLISNKYFPFHWTVKRTVMRPFDC